MLGHTTPISCLDLSKDGQIAVSGAEGAKSVIKIWDYNEAQCIA
jgi:WD40 repeat protein